MNPAGVPDRPSAMPGMTFPSHLSPGRRSHQPDQQLEQAVLRSPRHRRPAAGPVHPQRTATDPAAAGIVHVRPEHHPVVQPLRHRHLAHEADASLSTYGLGYTLEMPPYELNGKQVELTDTSGKPIIVQDYLDSRKAAALQGQVLQPDRWHGPPSRNVTAASTSIRTIPSTAASARAWRRPGIRKYTDGILGKLLGNGKTVIRGGYGRDLQPPERRRPGADSAARHRTGPGRLLHRRQQDRSVPGQRRASIRPRRSASGPTALSAPLPAVSADPAAAVHSRRERQRRVRLGLGARLATSGPARTDNFTLSIQREISPQGDPRSRLHRPHHPQRMAADRSRRRSLHDHAGRPELRFRPSPNLLRRGCESQRLINAGAPAVLRIRARRRRFRLLQGLRQLHRGRGQQFHHEQPDLRTIRSTTCGPPSTASSWTLGRTMPSSSSAPPFPPASFRPSISTPPTASATTTRPTPP